VSTAEINPSLDEIHLQDVPVLVVDIT